MFLRRYVRTKAGRQCAYFALVESVRTEAGPRQKIVAHLCELDADQQRRWQRTVVFHNRQGDARQLRLFPDDDEVPLPDDPDIVPMGGNPWKTAPSGVATAQDRLATFTRGSSCNGSDIRTARWFGTISI